MDFRVLSSQVAPSRLAIGALVVLIVGYVGGQLGYWVRDDTAPTTILRTEVNPVKAWPGGEIHVRYYVRRHRACSTKVERVVYDSQQLRDPLPTREFATSPGPVGDDSYVVAVPLRDTLHEGPAIYRIITSYECNPLHRLWPIVVPSQDVHFTIGPKPESETRRRKRAAPTRVGRFVE